MSLKFHSVERKVMLGPDEGETRFFAQVRCEEPVGLEKLCQRISELSAVTPGDVELVLDGFSKVMVNNLQMGHIIQMGDLGNFRVTAGSTGAQTPKDFHPRMIKRARILLSPGKMLRRVCSDMQFEKIKPIIKVEEGEPCPFPH